MCVSVASGTFVSITVSSCTFIWIQGTYIYVHRCQGCNWIFGVCMLSGEFVS